MNANRLRRGCVAYNLAERKSTIPIKNPTNQKLTNHRQDCFASPASAARRQACSQ